MLKQKRVGKGVFKVLTGVIVGGAIGSILGLTLAPKKGRETRRDIREKSLDMFLKGKAQLRRDQKMGTIKKTVIKILSPKKRTLSTKTPTDKNTR